MRVKAYFRNVEETDRELLFRWANDKETRRQSCSDAPIPWEEHTAWFARTQADADCRHWIFMVRGGDGRDSCTGEKAGDDGQRRGCCGVVERKSGTEEEAQPAGVLRLVKDGDSGAYRISYSIAPEWRGHGLGSLLLILAKKWAAAFCLDGTGLYGEVKAENAASVRCFEKAGYTREPEKTASAPCFKKAGDGNGQKMEHRASGAERAVRFCAEIPHDALLYFRADANRTIGYGHVMRCLTIADACVRKGLCPVFVTADHEAQETILDRGFPCLILNTDYRSMEPELAVLTGLLGENAPIVLDSYCLTKHYVGTLKERGHRVVWLDDLGEQGYPADMLINYNVYAKRLAYPVSREADTDVRSAERREDDRVYLLGPSYAPVRPAFRRERGVMRETIGTVLVTAGGADPYGAGAWFVRLLIKLLPDARIWAVCGPYAEGKEELRRISEQNGNVSVIEGCTDLSSLMHQSDLAVAAAGSTLYELCAAGLPGILYYVADNQRRGAEAFAYETGAVNLGDFRSDDFKRDCASHFAAALARLKAASERKKLSDAMHALVDGSGAERIAEALAKLVFTRKA